MRIVKIITIAGKIVNIRKIYENYRVFLQQNMTRQIKKLQVLDVLPRESKYFRSYSKLSFIPQDTKKEDPNSCCGASKQF